jgi:U32 family peptidase
MVSEDCIIATSLGCMTDKASPSGSARDRPSKHSPGKDAVDPGSFWGLRDSKKRIFPFSVDGECRTRLLNSVDLCLIDHAPSLVALGLDGWVIDARGKTPAYARDMAVLYRQALTVAMSGDSATVGAKLAALKEKVRKRALGGITTGYFLR